MHDISQAVRAEAIFSYINFLLSRAIIEDWKKRKKILWIFVEHTLYAEVDIYDLVILASQRKFSFGQWNIIIAGCRFSRKKRRYSLIELYVVGIHIKNKQQVV